MSITESPPQSDLEAPAPAAPEVPPGDREMTMLEHLHEFRHRLTLSVLAIMVGIVATLVPLPEFGSLTQFVMQKLVAQARAVGVELQFIRPGESFFTYLQVSLVLGIAVAMPMIVYQVLAFVSPALYPKEKRYLYMAVPGVTLSFVAGAVFCYALMLPFAIRFLGGFNTELIRAQWTAESYLDFVTNFLFWVGVTFELPIVMYFLTKLGVANAQRLAGFRRYALVLAFILGAMITPTPDPINQLIVSLPIYLLYEFGIILARFA